MVGAQDPDALGRGVGRLKDNHFAVGKAPRRDGGVRGGGVRRYDGLEGNTEGSAGLMHPVNRFPAQGRVEPALEVIDVGLHSILTSAS